LIGKGNLKKSRKIPVKKAKVERLPPTSEAARDEGPRLLPLSDRSKEPSRLEHYLDLADAALDVKAEKTDKGRIR
jgi:hypothetical protein